MKKYVIGRIIKSLISVFVVISIVIAMIFTMIPKQNIFRNDVSINKMQGDQKVSYMYNKWDELGYLDYLSQTDMCKAYAEDVDACIAGRSASPAVVLAKTAAQKDGYKIKQYANKKCYAVHEYNVLELLGHFYKRMLIIDNPHKVVDKDNPTLKRGYYWDRDHNGHLALMCSGCEFKYQLYVDGSFPYLHQNALKLNFGTSYPTKSGVNTLDVISENQGSLVNKEVVFPSGVTKESPVLLHTCKYKSSMTMDKFDRAKFNDNYADCANAYSSPSMITTSYIFGLASLVVAYVIALPAGIYMARKKGKFADKLGIAYINFLSSVPSLAFIFVVKKIGQGLGFPDKFPQFGFGDVRSYILPILILGLLSTSGLMLWTRRYMIDQANADYVKFARSKGLSESEIFNKHILKNAIIPIVNGIPASIILCISGSVITESVFAIPGMGKMLPDSINLLNNNMVITLTFVYTGLSVFSVLAGDLLMTVVDPRIKLVEKGE